MRNLLKKVRILRRIKRIFVDNFLAELISLLKELGLFFYNLLKYLNQFLKGLRLFSDSYSGLLSAMEHHREGLNHIRNERDYQKFLEDIRSWLKEINRLEGEHEKKFTALFGVFIALLALVISLIALFVSKG